MTKKIQQGLLMLFLSISVILPATVSADYLIPNDSMGTVSGTDPVQLIVDVTKKVLMIVGVLSVLIIIVGGIMYMISGGNDDKTANAKNWIMAAIIGLVVALLGYAIVAGISTLLIK
jgi:glucose uptake protein GlcU